MTTEHDYNQIERAEQPIDQTIEKVAPGTLLKQKREELGLTQGQISERLRLRVTIIQSIEDNQFEDGQVTTFTRGYLRSYAKAVGLAEDEVLCAFDEHHCQKAPLHPDMKSFSKKNKRQLHDSRIMLMTWVVFAVIVGMSSVWWWQNNQKNDVVAEQVSETPSTASALQTADDASIANEEFATVPPVSELDSNAPLSEAASTPDGAAPELQSPPIPVEPNNTNQPTQEPLAVEAPVVSAALTDSAPQAIVPVATQPSAQQESAPAVASLPLAAASEATATTNTTALLVMNFSADCWIQVKDATGKTLATGVKKAGESLNLNGQRPYKVVLGAPEGVSITLASEPVDLSEYTSGKVARLTLP